MFSRPSLDYYIRTHTHTRFSYKNTCIYYTRIPIDHCFASAHEFRSGRLDVELDSVHTRIILYYNANEYDGTNTK